MYLVGSQIRNKQISCKAAGKKKERERGVLTSQSRKLAVAA
jgi:hypothetical protein